MADLLAAFGSIGALFEARAEIVRLAARLPAEAATEFQPSALERRLRDAEAELRRLGDEGGWAVGLDDPDYPALLRTIPDPPPVLFGVGRRQALTERAVAVVGTRRATPYGAAAAKIVAGDLASAGLVVVSGLARGIDAIAHQAALDEGGSTVAVLGSGLGRVYPWENRGLARAIRDGGAGAVVSEHVWETDPRPGNFPARNRVISGVSLAVVVVESDEKGGALITADCALEQGREVLAVPGPITSRFSRGPHALVYDGAKMVRSGQDVLEILGIPARAPTGARSGAKEPAGPMAREALIVLTALDVLPTSLDELIERTGLAPEAVAAVTSILEVDGLVRRMPGPVFVRLNS
jgi:DNA processing protein